MRYTWRAGCAARAWCEVVGAWHGAWHGARMTGKGRGGGWWVRALARARLARAEASRAREGRMEGQVTSKTGRLGGILDDDCTFRQVRQRTALARALCHVLAAVELDVSPEALVGGCACSTECAIAASEHSAAHAARHGSGTAGAGAGASAGASVKWAAAAACGAGVVGSSSMRHTWRWCARCERGAVETVASARCMARQGRRRCTRARREHAQLGQ